MNRHIVDRICEALGVSQAELARDLKITRAAVNDWKSKNKHIPVKHCVLLEEKLKQTNDPLTCIDMRPDDWMHYWPDMQNKRNEKAA